MKQVHVVFLEILGTVESALCQLAALVRYSGPVRLTHHEADSTLSICVLLLFEVSPSNLDKDSQRCLFMTRENHLRVKGSTRRNRVFPKRSESRQPSSLRSSPPFSSPARTSEWRSRRAAGGSRRGLQRPHVSSSRCLQVHPTCLWKWEIGGRSIVNIAAAVLVPELQKKQTQDHQDDVSTLKHKHICR